MRRLLKGVALWVLAFAAVPGTGLRAQTSAGRSSSVTVDELVVTARPPSNPAGEVPDIAFGEEDILSQGAGTVLDLLDALSARALTGAAGESPVILLNGRLIRNTATLAGIPPEALKRVEFLGAGADVKYGSRAGRQVVNIVLRDHFNGLTTQGTGGTATEGGRASVDARSNFLRIDEGARWSADVRYTHDDALLERERGVSTLALALPAGVHAPDIQTLLPEQEEIGASFTLTKDLAGGAQAELSGSLVANRSVDMVEAAGAEQGSVSAVRLGAQNHLYDLGLMVQNQESRWQWSLAASLDDRQTFTTTDYRPLDGRAGAGGVNGYRTRADVLTPGLEAIVSGPLFALPAGSTQVTFKLDLDRTRLSQSSTQPGAVEADTLARGRVYLNGSVDIPLTGGRSKLNRLGSLSANVNFAIEHLSDFGALTTYGAGLNWSPVPKLKLNASVSSEERAPGLEQLGSPVLLRPSVPWFDQLTGETVDVTTTQGGNPDLKASVQRIVRVGATFRIAKKLGLSTRFTQTLIKDPIVSIATLGAEAERVFPSRFTRGPDGRLVGVDVRPVNIGRTTTSDLDSGLDFSAPLGRAPHLDAGAATGGRNRPQVTISLHHLLRLENTQVLAPGLDPIDFLQGEGGTFYPRHLATLQIAVLGGGMGARLNGTWQSAARLRYASGGGAPTGDLTYAPIGKLNLELFTDLADLLHVGGRRSWASGARLTLSVDNLFDTRPHVQDAQGRTPTAYLPALMDPVGRSIKLTLRKQF